MWRKSGKSLPLRPKSKKTVAGMATAFLRRSAQTVRKWGKNSEKVYNFTLTTTRQRGICQTVLLIYPSVAFSLRTILAGLPITIE